MMKKLPKLYKRKFEILASTKFNDSTRTFEIPLTSTLFFIVFLCAGYLDRVTTKTDPF